MIKTDITYIVDNQLGSGAPGSVVTLDQHIYRRMLMHFANELLQAMTDDERWFLHFLEHIESGRLLFTAIEKSLKCEVPIHLQPGELKTLLDALTHFNDRYEEFRRDTLPESCFIPESFPAFDFTKYHGWLKSAESHH